MRSFGFVFACGVSERGICSIDGERGPGGRCLCWGGFAPCFDKPFAQPERSFRPRLALYQGVKKLVAHGVDKKLPRGERTQRLCGDPISFSEGRDPARRERGLAK